MILTISHIDTCLSCYLQDHHNREDECMIGVPVDGSTTIAAVRSMVSDEFHGNDYNIPKTVTDAMIDVAIAECFQGNDDSELFDDGLEPSSDDDDESCQAWFLLTWGLEDC